MENIPGLPGYDLCKRVLGEGSDALHEVLISTSPSDYPGMTI
jgi:hypothetical protein